VAEAWDVFSYVVGNTVLLGAFGALASYVLYQVVWRWGTARDRARAASAAVRHPDTEVPGVGEYVTVRHVAQWRWSVTLTVPGDGLFGSWGQRFVYGGRRRADRVARRMLAAFRREQDRKKDDHVIPGTTTLRGQKDTH